MHDNSETTPQHRSYQALVERVRALSKDASFQVDVFAATSYLERSLPLLRVLTTTSSSAPRENVFLSAGMHGDEPAAVEALLRFAEGPIRRFTEQYNFLIYPCLNPHGFERDTRHNHRGMDLNRVFCSTSPEGEVTAFLQSIDTWKGSFALALDLHEDNPEIASDVSFDQRSPASFYLYESSLLSSLRIGAKIVRRLRQEGIEICEWPTIYGDTNKGGVVEYGVESTNTAYSSVNGLFSCLLARFTNLAITTETPLAWSFENRVQAQITAIIAALESQRELQQATFLGSGI